MAPSRAVVGAGGVLLFAVVAAAWVSASTHGHAQSPGPATARGVVAGSEFSAPSGQAPARTAPAYYQHAVVCADTNDNGACDTGEPATQSDDAGAFVLANPGGAPLVAEIGADSTLARRRVGRRIALRASAAQSAQNPVVISPLSTEIVRMMEADTLDDRAARRKLATRLDVPARDLLRDPRDVTDAVIRRRLLGESVILTDRFALATRMVDRHDVSPAALAANAAAAGPAISMPEAEQAAMNLEGIPRYDHLFVIMLENKATASIRNSPFAPKINAYLAAGNQFTSYFASGNPSEPNRVAVTAGDDFGIVDDKPWNCVPSGDAADLPDDPLPAGMAPCANPTNHNLKNAENLLSALSAAGMSWRVYSESMNPGRDWRLDSAADSAILAPDHLYSPGSPVGAIGTPGLMLPMPARLYATKHNESMDFQHVRSSPDFARNNRTMGGGQWDAAMKAAGTPPGWDMDQLGTDLARSDVGTLNFLEPDQCDDMHHVKVQGAVPGSATLVAASDCDGDAIIYRGDNYTDYLIRKIEAAPVWTNVEQRTAIVIMFDEGKAVTGFNSCCGWNPSAGRAIAGESLGPLVKHPDGTVSIDRVAGYNQGNKGHGTSIFGVITNQPRAPKHVVDSDAYSHISFVRTMQDMFGLADPGDDWSYINRSKYTERFIAAHLNELPEYRDSRDRHFDAVRPMNHAYVIPSGYVQKSGFVTPPGAQVGPDANQLNVWALTGGGPSRTPHAAASNGAQSRR
ncbi:MAG TPA: alkaline phosphatase family protein [Vicinamibacterales bacterium]|nr:alkaline phosphatase family protein [Vicinamibacterales bacterium]